MTIQDRLLMNHLISELDSSQNQFQQKLKSRFPHLTAYNLRLCIYLKANLSTKEIATLLNIAPDSVKKAKHRLRKKLDIEPSIRWHEAIVSV